jgi:hypothetical protein
VSKLQTLSAIVFSLALPQLFALFCLAIIIHVSILHWTLSILNCFNLFCCSTTATFPGKSNVHAPTQQTNPNWWFNCSIISNWLKQTFNCLSSITDFRPFLSRTQEIRKKPEFAPDRKCIFWCKMFKLCDSGDKVACNSFFFWTDTVPYLIYSK